MTNTGMFEDAERIEYLEEQNKFLRKKLKEATTLKLLIHLKLILELKIGIYKK